MSYTFVDDYCGSGGSSQGLREAGFELVQAANHNPKAIETHAANFPNADHLETDLMIYDMRRRPHSDLYWASPECTWHSPAGGRKRKRQMLDMFEEYVPDAAGQRSRLTMMQVVAFAEVKRPKIVLVENVVEVAGWELFEAWLHAMTSLGYEHQILSVSAAHIWSEENAPAPQWRDRIYFVFYQKGIDFPDVSPRPWAFCPRCCEDVRAVQSWKHPERRHIGKYGPQYVYVCPSDGHKTTRVDPYVMPALDALDLSDLGELIGNRKKPLAAATERRIKVGACMFATDPQLVAHVGHTWDAAKPGHRHYGDPAAYYRVQSAADGPRATVTGTPGEALVHPFALQVHHGGEDGRAFDPLAAPWPTRSTKLGDALVTPAGGTWNTDAYPAENPFRTRTTSDMEALVTSPFMVQRRDYNGADASRVHSVGEPMSTRTASDRGIHGLVVPSPFTVTLRRNSRAAAVAEGPLSTVTAGGNHHGVVVPEGSFLSKHHGGLDYERIEHMNKSLGEPLATVVARPNISLVTPTKRPKLDLSLADLESVDISSYRFRMLKWREHANAQRFPRSYIFTGNSSENTMMAGNAVASNVAHYLGRLALIALSSRTKRTEAAA